MSKLWHIPLWFVTAAVLAWIGHGLLFTSFMLYDDEGYILLTLRNQIEHGGLYDRVYTQYGPFFYAMLGGLSRLLDFEWNNTSGRWFTLVNWLATSGLCGLLVWRCHRLWAAALFTSVSIFAMLWIMLQEPVHPGGLIAVLVALTAFVGAECIRNHKPRRLAVCVGVLGALIALTKINAGTFVVMAGGLWLLATQSGNLRRTALALALLASAAVPFALMRPLMDQAWVPPFALLAALSSVSTVMVASECGQSRSGPRHLLWFAGAGVASTLLVVVWTLAQGSSLHGLLHGVILGPMHHPDVYSFPVKWRPLVVPAAVAGLGLAGAWALRPNSPATLHMIALARVAVALTTAFAMWPASNTSVAALALCYGVPAAALFAIPLLKNDDHSGGPVRSWLALLLALQSMQAFPIAGSQLNWGTFLWIPLMTLGLIDTMDFWAARSRPVWSRVFGVVGASLACVFVVIQARQYIHIREARIMDGMPLGLRDAENILLPAPVSSALHVVAVNAAQNAGTLFSLPGVFSFNQWTDKPAPTLRNVTHWFSLLSEDEQREIIDAMSADPRACFVLQRPLVAFLTKNGFPVRGPLVGYLDSHYRQTVEVDGFSLWIRRERATPTAFLIATRTSSEPSRIGINLPPIGEPIARLEAIYYDSSTSAAPTDDAARPRSLSPRIQPLDPHGNLEDAAMPFAWPLPAGAARQLTFDFAAKTSDENEKRWIFRFVAEDGRTLAFARFSR